MTQASEGGLSPLDEAGIEKVIAAALAAEAARWGACPHRQGPV